MGTGVTDTEQDTLTGWETEREAFFTAQNQIAKSGIYSRDDMSAVDIGDLATGILRFASSVERLGDASPVVDSTTQIVVTERKKGVGQKKDDHESQEHKFTQQMY